jgi:RNA polymerase sigma-70 factor (ECF subfamily)
MIALRLDRRLQARIDPSDVLQESLADAAQQLSDYLRHRPIPFYAWLRQFAWRRLVALHRDHIAAQKRSVTREEQGLFLLSEESAAELAHRLWAHSSSPSERVMRQELRGRVRTAIAQLGERDREILVLRQLEQLSTRETAAVLGISETAAKVRHVRALQRFGRLLGIHPSEE